MTEPLERNFGLIIAFLLPGFTCIFGVGSLNPTVAGWLSDTPSNSPSIGGFLYVTLGSLAAGLIVSAIRWAVIDSLHHKTGIPRPNFNFKRLNENLPAYQLAVEYNYRYFQFYANMTIAIPIFTFCCQSAFGVWSFSTNFAVILLEVVLFAASRDCLRRYYERLSLVLGLRGTREE